MFLLIALVLYGFALAAMVRSARLALKRAVARLSPTYQPDALKRVVHGSAAVLGAGVAAFAIVAGICIRIFGALSWGGLEVVYHGLLNPSHQFVRRTTLERLGESQRNSPDAGHEHDEP